jgi:hypothetical protein
VKSSWVKRPCTAAAHLLPTEAQLRLAAGKYAGNYAALCAKLDNGSQTHCTSAPHLLFNVQQLC